MIKCDLSILKGFCYGKATRYFILSNNCIRAFCPACLKYVPGEMEEITQEQYLNYQILK